MTSQTGLYHISTNLEIQRIAKKLYHANCATEAKSIRNWQNIITMSNEGASLKPYFDDGYVAVKGGVAIHILKCDAIQASVDFEREGCFAELPIKIPDGNGSFKNGTYWAHPVTKILLPKSTPMPCHPKLPMVYKIDGQRHHYCSYGHGLTKCPDPDLITPTSADLHNQLKADIAAPMGAGVMTDTQARKIQFRIFHHQYVHHIEAENLIKNKVNVETGQPLEIIPSKSVEEKWKWDIGIAIAPFYAIFGNVYVWIIGLIMLCTVVGASCGLGARLYMELTVNGFTYRLFFAIFQGLYHIATVPLEFIKSGYRGTVKYQTQGLERSMEPLQKQIAQLQDQIDQLTGNANFKASRVDPEAEAPTDNPFRPPSYFSGGSSQPQAPPIWDLRHDTPSVFTPLSPPQPEPEVKDSIFNMIFNRKALLESRARKRAQRVLQDLEAQPLHVINHARERVHRPTAPPPPPRFQTPGPYQNVTSAVQEERGRVIHSPETVFFRPAQGTAANIDTLTLTNAQQADQYQEEQALIPPPTSPSVTYSTVSDDDNIVSGFRQLRGQTIGTLKNDFKPIDS